MGSEKLRVVSNSEVGTLQACEMRHHFAFVENLAPKVTLHDGPIYSGVCGHEMLAAYYDCWQKGGDRNDRILAAWEALDKLAEEEGANLHILTKLRMRMMLYHEFWQERDMNNRIIEVETVHITGGYGLRLDLLWWNDREKRFEIVDHKFMYNFLSQIEARMSPQLIKYIAVLRGEGVSVNYGMFNQFRTRDIKEPSLDQLFKREPVKPLPGTRDKVMDDQDRWAERVLKAYEPGFQPLRAMSSYNCKRCAFQNLCLMELDGQDTTLTKRVSYTSNTYGYSGDE